MNKIIIFIWLLLAPIQPLLAKDMPLYTELALVMEKRDMGKITAAIQQALQQRGNEAGQPDQPEQWIYVAAAEKPIAPPSIKTVFQPYIGFYEQYGWWTKKTALSSPQHIPTALRAIAELINGAVDAQQLQAVGAEKLLANAMQGAEVVMAAQKIAGNGVYPVPAWRKKQGRVPALANNFLEKAERDGVLSSVEKEGWIINDRGHGDLAFDNGVVGEAMLRLFHATGNERYRQSALWAADWALRQPIVPNFNYNAFHALLLAEAYKISGDKTYIKEAIEKLRLGFFSGMVQSGPWRGSWVDGHNARLVYRYIMIRAAVKIVAALPSDTPPNISTELLANLRAAIEAADQLTLNHDAVAAYQQAAYAVCEANLLIPDLLASFGQEFQTNHRAANQLIFKAAWQAYAQKNGPNIATLGCLARLVAAEK
ncbi:MAG: hypothetical protein ACOYK8_08570 [Alphaproteobacteria bacterium]